MNASKPPMKKDRARQSVSVPADQNSMEWNVNAGRAGAAGGMFDTGQIAEQDGYHSYKDDDDLSDSPGFSLDLKRFLVGAWQRRYIGIATVVVITVLTALFVGFSVSKSWQASTALIKRTQSKFDPASCKLFQNVLSTSRMISSFSDAGYLILRFPHPRSCFF